jgi:hypothetical protein
MGVNSFNLLSLFAAETDATVCFVVEEADHTGYF